MEPGKSLLVSFQPSQTKEDKDEGEDSLSKEISLDYSDDDVEMSDAEEHPKRRTKKNRDNQYDSFAPVEDVDIFAVGDDHVDTSGGEIRRETKVQMIFDTEKLGGPPQVKRYMNPKLGRSDEFSSFLNSSEQRSRRMERAKRFGLESTTSESASSEEPMIDDPTPDVIDKLYAFYDIDPESVRHKEKYRLNAIYLRGIDRLSTDNIFDYFGPYNPVYLEWIDDNSCNLVWKERLEAARALLGVSRPLRRVCPLKASDEGNTNKKNEENEHFVSPLKRPQREEPTVMPPVVDASPVGDEDTEKILDDDVPLDVDISCFTVPPGQWRVGKKDHTSRAILIRFTTIDDVKNRGAQRKSRYYQEHGNPNFGGQTGFISRSYVDRITRKRHRPNENETSVPDDLRKSLGDRERWNLLREDGRRDPELEPGELVEEEDLQTGDVKLTYYSSDEEDIEDERSKKRPRMRMRADEEAGRKEKNRRRLQQIKSRGGGIEGDWRSGQVSHAGGDLRNRLRDTRIKVTVTNDLKSKQDLRHRLGSKKTSNWDDDGSGDDAKGK